MQSNEKIVCIIYRSEKWQGAYLYAPFNSATSALQLLPEPLLESLGELNEVMTLTLSAERQLAIADVNVVMREIVQQGYYLQMPPALSRFST